jgi:hypothetical protein|eukprot:COSAG01_NODE_4813_length_4725_cov_2.371812_2_plen_82_part_00
MVSCTFCVPEPSGRPGSVVVATGLPCVSAASSATGSRSGASVALSGRVITRWICSEMSSTCCITAASPAEEWRRHADFSQR